MAIWFKSISCELLNERGIGTMADFLNIKFTKIGEDFLEAEMPFSDRIKQPIGIVHGGANVVLAETIASTAANAVLDLSKEYAVGLEINANHLRSIREGVIFAMTKPIHLGRTTQVWHIELRDEHNKLTCISRMTAAILKRR
jgi:1,4-dihydroxy-2-naphthoyl-CoA hydrolase